LRRILNIDEERKGVKERKGGGKKRGKKRGQTPFNGPFKRGGVGGDLCSVEELAFFSSSAR